MFCFFMSPDERGRVDKFVRENLVKLFGKEVPQYTLWKKTLTLVEDEINKGY